MTPPNSSGLTKGMAEVDEKQLALMNALLTLLAPRTNVSLEAEIKGMEEMLLTRYGALEADDYSDVHRYRAAVRLWWYAFSGAGGAPGAVPESEVVRAEAVKFLDGVGDYLGQHDAGSWTGLSRALRLAWIERGQAKFNAGNPGAQWQSYLEDPELDWGERGLLAFLEYHKGRMVAARELVDRNREGKFKILTLRALKGLNERGYVGLFGDASFALGLKL